MLQTGKEHVQRPCGGHEEERLKGGELGSRAKLVKKVREAR